MSLVVCWICCVDMLMDMISAARRTLSPCGAECNRLLARLCPVDKPAGNHISIDEAEAIINQTDLLNQLLTMNIISYHLDTISAGSRLICWAFRDLVSDVSVGFIASSPPPP